MRTCDEILRAAHQANIDATVTACESDTYKAFFEMLDEELFIAACDEAAGVVLCESEIDDRYETDDGMSYAELTSENRELLKKNGSLFEEYLNIKGYAAQYHYNDGSLRIHFNK